MSIEIQGLSHVYNADTSFEKIALNDVNLHIDNGEFIGLIGHTGSGKSTLIQHLNALLVPSKGKILLNGEDINVDRKKLKSVRQRVGLVFQYPEHQLFEMTVYKDVAYGPSNLGLSREEIDSRVKAAIKLVGLNEDVYEKSPFELSGGQKRRVAIAGVIAMQPEVLVLDEPTAGLDPRGRDEILNAINDMRRELKITVILVSHSMEDVARLVERIIVMDGGKVALMGTPAEVFSQIAEIERIGLAAPQVSYVFARLRELGYKVADDIYTIEEATKALHELLR